jgi:hypothetical protein
MISSENFLVRLSTYKLEKKLEMNQAREITKAPKKSCLPSTDSKIVKWSRYDKANARKIAARSAMYFD